MSQPKLIKKESELFAVLIPSDLDVETTQFFTGDDDFFQVGVIYKNAGHIIPRHSHRQFSRTVTKTSEALILWHGLVKVHIFDNEDQVLYEGLINEKDVLVLLNGSHKFEFLKAGFFLEIKQGPYIQEQDKIFHD